MMNIIRNDEYYDMYIDGNYIGSYETVVKAADAYEEIQKEKEA